MNRCIFTFLVAAFMVSGAAHASTSVEVAVSAQKYAARPGDVFPVDYIVSWEGAPGAYTVLPPQLPALDWGLAELLEIRTRSWSNRHETRVSVGYRANEAGIYTAPSLALRVIAWDEPGITEITALDESTPTQVLDAAAITITVRPSRTGLWAGVIVLAVVAGALTVWVMRRRHAVGAARSGLSPAEQAQSLLHDARRSRLDGDFYAFYRALCDALNYAAPDASASHQALYAKLQEAVDDTGYRGVRPSDDAMEGDFKDVERIVAQALRRDAKEN